MKSFFTCLFLSIFIVSCGTNHKDCYENKPNLSERNNFIFFLIGNSPGVMTTGLKFSLRSDILDGELTENNLKDIVNDFREEYKSKLYVVFYQKESFGYAPAYLLVSEAIFQKADRFFVGYIDEGYEQIIDNLDMDDEFYFAINHDNYSFVGEYKSIIINISNHNFLLFSLRDTAPFPHLGEEAP